MAFYLFAPMFLIVPMMIFSVIAADSFVGKRERVTLQALLWNGAKTFGREELQARL